MLPDVSGLGLYEGFCWLGCFSKLNNQGGRNLSRQGGRFV